MSNTNTKSKHYITSQDDYAKLYWEMQRQQDIRNERLAKLKRRKEKLSKLKSESSK